MVLPQSLPPLQTRGRYPLGLLSYQGFWAGPSGLGKPPQCLEVVSASQPGFSGVGSDQPSAA